MRATPYRAPTPPMKYRGVARATKVALSSRQALTGHPVLESLRVALGTSEIRACMDCIRDYRGVQDRGNELRRNPLPGKSVNGRTGAQ
jgi:hypothetical protein